MAGAGFKELKTGRAIEDLLFPHPVCRLGMIMTDQI
jgi:hypothetical protein